MKSYNPDIVKNVLQEVIHKIDREFPVWLEYKASVIDVVKWGLLEIDKKHKNIENSKNTIPKERQKEIKKIHEEVALSLNKVPQSESLDSGEMPNWLKSGLDI